MVAFKCSIACAGSHSFDSSAALGGDDFSFSAAPEIFSVFSDAGCRIASRGRPVVGDVPDAAVVVEEVEVEVVFTAAIAAAAA